MSASIKPPVPSFSNSVVANLGKALGAEMIGAFIGSRLEGAAISLLRSSPMTLLGVGSLALLASRISGATHPILKGVLFALPALWTASHLLNPSTAVGEIAGTIVGGYLGLKWLNPQVQFFGEEHSSGYGISTLRFELIGLFFRSLNLTSSLPYVTVPLTAALFITKIALQNIAFHSNRLIPLIKGALQPAQREKWTVCNAAKVWASRYVTSDVKNTLNSLLNFDIPFLGTKMSSIATTLGVEEACVDYLAPETWPQFLTFSFPAYVTSIETSEGWQEASSAHREAFFEDFSDEEKFLSRLETIVIPKPPVWMINSK